MSHVKARDFEDVVKRWRVREVERFETFLRLVALGGCGWSATRSWGMHEGAGVVVLDRLMRTRDGVRGGGWEAPVQVLAMQRGQGVHSVIEHDRHTERLRVKLFESGERWSKSKVGVHLMEKQVGGRGPEWALRCEVGVQTEGGGDDGDEGGVVREGVEMKQMPVVLEAVLLRQQLRESQVRVAVLEEKIWGGGGGRGRWGLCRVLRSRHRWLRRGRRGWVRKAVWSEGRRRWGARVMGMRRRGAVHRVCIVWIQGLAQPTGGCRWRARLRVASWFGGLGWIWGGQPPRSRSIQKLEASKERRRPGRGGVKGPLGVAGCWGTTLR